MAAPNVTHYAAGGSAGAAVTTQAVTITTTGATVGGKILILVTSDGNPTINADATSISNGWTKIGQWSSGTACTLAAFVFDVVTAATVPGLTYTLSASENCYQFQETISPTLGTLVVYRLATLPTAATGTNSANPDPPIAIQDSGATQSVLWIAAFAGDSGTVASTAQPSGYTLLSQTSAGNAANGCALGAAFAKQIGMVHNSTENPGVFTRPSEDWVAQTLGFYEGAPVGGKMKVWSGSAWVEKPVKVWNGSAWVAKPLKFWNGSAWVLS